MIGNPKQMIPVIDFNGQAAFIQREQLIRMLGNFEASSLIKEADRGELDGILNMTEKGFGGFENMSDGKLTKKWDETRDDYERMREGGELIAEDHIDFLFVGPDEQDDVLKQIDQALEMQKYDPLMVPVDLSDWQTEDERSPDAPESLQGRVDVNKESIELVIYDSENPFDLTAARTVSVELQNGDLRVRNYMSDCEAPLVTEMPGDGGEIRVNRHDYDVERISAAEDTQSGPKI
ncbi:hypothetical protein [Sulfitobacter sp. R18_1]|uniref:hypothetical protein n=1 Tax=Sulfitobacter sp. R18_1 TaxID=2821104 RepID=UPI001ADA52E1|nr:hypothetical protein [Sulfitobacter sp. R18_1]MBO9428813.1 hypothetical protein [Sulfitobacter sp. R18_1]